MLLNLELSQIENFNVNRKPINTSAVCFADNEIMNKKNHLKKSKWRIVTSELAMFNVKTSVKQLNNNTESFDSIDDETVQVCKEATFIDYESCYETDDIFCTGDLDYYNDNDEEYIIDALYSVNRLVYYKYLNQDNAYKETKQTYLKNSEQLRSKKSNKKIKLKAAIKTNSFLAFVNITSAEKNFRNIDIFKKIQFSSLLKSKSKLHIKYNIYNKLFIEDPWNGRLNLIEQSFVNRIDRAKYLFAKSKISNFEEIKAVSKAHTRNLVIVNKKETVKQQELPQALNVFTIDHDRVNNEISDNYDQLYVEFLISLQHREITPEDYEYLTRLDELVKKKTISENKLNKLKCESVNEDNVVKFLNDICAICMEPYLVGQTRKLLPCAHVFHDVCIDAWLSQNSTKCPLDQISIDNTTFSRSISILSQ